MKPWGAVEDFEKAIGEYTGAPYVTCVNSASAAILLALLWHQPKTKAPLLGVHVPRKTYISVPMAVQLTGCFFPDFMDKEWSGIYQLKPLPVWDCALRFTSGMYEAAQFQCVSFAAAKILGIEQGGAILHDNREADLWFKKMRFDGRTSGADVDTDDTDVIGYHVPMLPSIAAQGILRLSQLPKHNPDQVRTYPDISKKSCFK